jgi:hypothetical protein
MKEKIFRTVEGIERTFIYGKRDVTWKPVVSSIIEDCRIIGDTLVMLDHGQYGYEYHCSVHICPKDNPGYHKEIHRFEPGKVENTRATSRGFFEKLIAEYESGIRK